MQGKLLLSVAADAGKMDEVDWLLSQGVDVNAFGYFHGSEYSEVDRLLSEHPEETGFVGCWGLEVNATLDVPQTADMPLTHVTCCHSCSEWVAARSRLDVLMLTAFLL